MNTFLNRPKRNNLEFDSLKTERKPKYGKYDKIYLNYSFIYAVARNEESLRCVIWSNVIGIESIS